MVSDNLADALGDLLNGELEAHHAYLQAAGWAADRNLDGCKAFLLAHAAEELGHMHKIFAYMVDLGVPIRLKTLPAPVVRANDVVGLFTEIRDRERAVTQSIGAVVDLAARERHHGTFQFLQWFVAEQHEEDSLCKSLLDKIALIGDGPNALYLIDKEIGHMAHRDQAT
ncbi:ferritin [Chelatococcus reniformis]|uniref:Ferritin n=1 Tax=Chelatococcus reniformis TaxID=1494448 RepID=A0A916XDY8_9HYPH|nr:ferritin [Chelatococcus reniformis]GGC64685.1 ferritin [Chelatococcus reniformis]